MTQIDDNEFGKTNGFQKQMTDPVIIEMLTYWENLRAGRSAPSRSEVDPRQIQSSLEHTFILERVRDGHPRVRLAGMAVCDLLGMELRGMPARSLFDIDSRDRFDEFLDDVLEKSQVTELYLRASIDQDDITHGRMLLLPLLDDLGQKTRVMGCITLNSKVFRPPIRFKIEEAKITRIVAGKSIEFDAPLLELTNDDDPENARQQPELRQIVGNPSIVRERRELKRPQLRLVKNSD